MQKVKEVYKKIKSLDLTVLSQKAAEGIKKFVKENWFNLTPFLLLPTSILVGGDVGLATRASLELSAGLYALDRTLDQIIETAEEVLPPQYLVALVAGTTNLAELGASQAAAFSGDPLSEVAATPIGSNPTNLYLTGFALLGALKARAINEGIIKEGEQLNLRVVRDTLTSIDWKKVKKEFGLAGLFALDALIFQFFVRPNVKKGDFVPLGGWLMLNIPLLVEYFRRGLFTKKAKINNAIENIGRQHIEKVREEILMEEHTYEKGVTPLLNLLSLIELYKETEEAERREVLEELEKMLDDLKSQIENDPDFQKAFSKLMSKAEMKDIRAFLEVTKIKFSEKRKVSMQKIVKLIGGIGAVAGISTFLDSGVTHMAEALPNFSKGAAGFFIMSFLSSIGEFLTTKKFFEKGKDRDAMRNMADSNALNIGLAKAAMASSTVKNLLL